MATVSATAPIEGVSAPVPAALSPGEAGRLWRRLVRKPPAILGAFVILGWVAASVLAPALAPYDPIDINVDHRLDPPSEAHWLGVDGLGRDVLSRVLYGGRVSLPAASVVVVVASIFGTLYGGLAAYLGKWPDEVAMRIVDMVLAFPSLILAMAIAAALGPSIQNSMLALLVVWWPPYARLARGQVLALKARDFVAAAQALGADAQRTLLRHILPNAVAPSLVLMAMDFGNAIIITAALSFLGLGAVPPTPEWGAMVAEGRELTAQWWISAFPGIAILMVAIACNFIGDELRDAIDPRLRGR
ncbi:MAG: D,D-dipeptide ABC transporter permease [Candidatus Rokuibacteriota bacterium]|nr:MAG: D,D-dipeptide ABC transporter permease [Candidatus Rokubacteria bacterium]